jgi:hypothetical protein
MEGRFAEASAGVITRELLQGHENFSYPYIRHDVMHK